MPIKECNRHGLTNHIKRDAKGKKFRCGKCSAEAVTRHRKRLKAKAISYKGGACINCGYSKCDEALEFHHRDPSEKDFDFGRTIAWEKVQLELDKCDLLCANCHRETHVRMNTAV